MTNEQRDNLLLSVAKKVEAMSENIESLNQKTDIMSKNIDSLNQKTDIMSENIESLNQKTEELDEKGKQRDDLLLSVAKKVEAMSENIESLNQKTDIMSENIESLNQKTEQYHQEALENHQTVVKELERQRINVAKLEHNLTEQIRALYDLCDVNNDKLQEHNEMFKEIQRTLDWHNRRILRLETTN